MPSHLRNDDELSEMALKKTKGAIFGEMPARLQELHVSWKSKWEEQVAEKERRDAEGDAETSPS
jgi:hypothetical protein